MSLEAARQKRYRDQRTLKMKAMEEALAPFSRAADVKLCGDDWKATDSIQGTDLAFYITFGDLKRAKDALKS